MYSLVQSVAVVKGNVQRWKYNKYCHGSQVSLL